MIFIAFSLKSWGPCSSNSASYAILWHPYAYSTEYSVGNNLVPEFVFNQVIGGCPMLWFCKFHGICSPTMLTISHSIGCNFGMLVSHCVGGSNVPHEHSHYISTNVAQLNYGTRQS